jgi:hypothetical protein
LQIQDDALRKAVTPNFSIGCKRLLFANNYYPALQQDNVTLLPQGLVEIDGQTVIAANGERFEVDVIIWEPVLKWHTHRLDNGYGMPKVSDWLTFGRIVRQKRTWVQVWKMCRMHFWYWAQISWSMTLLLALLKLRFSTL